MERIQHNFEKMIKILYSSDDKQFEKIKKVYETIEHRIRLNKLVMECEKKNCDKYVDHTICSYYDYLVYKGKKEKLVKEAKEKNLIGSEYLNTSSLWTETFQGNFINKKGLMCKVSKDGSTEIKLVLIYEEKQTEHGKSKELSLLVNNQNLSTITLLNNKGKIVNETDSGKESYKFTVNSNNQIKKLKKIEKELLK